MFKHILILVNLILFWNQAEAQYFQKDMMNQRQMAREDLSWNIGDWLAQKQKFALMDQWLYMNRTGYWFDLSLGGAHQNYLFKIVDSTSNERHAESGWKANASLYIFMLGAEANYEKVSPDRIIKTGSGNLRLLGTHLQSTNLIAKYGLRQYENEVSKLEWENQFVEGELNIYLIKYFGIQGRYQHIYSDKNSTGTELSGRLVSAGAFIQWGVFRIQGDYFEEPIILTPANGTETKETRQGYNLGGSISF